MPTADNVDYVTIGLGPLGENMLEQYYSPIEVLCEEGRTQCEQSLSTEPTAHYLSLCTALLSDTELFVKCRRDIYIPYVYSLAEKSDTEHDCTDCASGCKANHGMQVASLKASNNLMRERLNVFQRGLPELDFSITNMLLSRTMAMIEINLLDALSAEVNYLIPKTIEAQKSINAGS